MGILKLLNLRPQALSIKRVNPFFGVEVHGLPRVRKINGDHIKKLKKLISEFGVVILRNKAAWSETEQVNFTKMLGNFDSPLIFSTNTPSDPKVLKIWPNAQQSGLQWHSDRSYLERPCHLSIFQMVVQPSIGNETSFLNLHHVYQNLSREIQKKWANYNVIYADKRVSHPLFWIHPFTGKKSIYFDFRFAQEIIDICNTNKHMEIKDINEIIQILDQAFSQEKASYLHVWKKNDVIILDNYAISHKANFVAEVEDSRVLMRTSTEGIYF